MRADLRISSLHDDGVRQPVPRPRLRIPYVQGGDLLVGRQRAAARDLGAWDRWWPLLAHSRRSSRCHACSRYFFARIFLRSWFSSVLIDSVDREAEAGNLEARSRGLAGLCSEL